MWGWCLLDCRYSALIEHHTAATFSSTRPRKYQKYFTSYYFLSSSVSDDSVFWVSPRPFSPGGPM